MPQRRQFLRHAAAVAAAAAFGPALAAPAQPLVEVWKSPSCGCCQAWIDHLQTNGFQVKAHDVPGPADYREKFGLAAQYGSCHTAKVQGYVLEGHVPASEIRRLLKERPQALGLAVPGMPVGSPGMEVQGGRVDAYDVLLVTQDNHATVYQRYR